MPRVIVLGSINVDLVAEVDTLPRAGQTVVIRALRDEPGGKGANQAVAAARLGADVNLISAIGGDPAGESMKANLILEGIGVAHVRPAGVRSGTALIFLSADSENVIAVAPGANAELGNADAQAAIELVTPGSVLLCQLEVPLDVVRAAIAGSRARGAICVLNAAPASPLDPELLAMLDVLVVNETEAAVLLGEESGSEAWSLSAAARLRDFGPAAVILTMGGDGAVLADDGGSVHVPVFPVDPIDTVGAGDAFVGAIAFELARGTRLRDAAVVGAAAGALTTTRRGAQAAMPTSDDVRQLVATLAVDAYRPGKPNAS